VQAITLNRHAGRPSCDMPELLRVRKQTRRVKEASSALLQGAFALEVLACS